MGPFLLSSAGLLSKKFLKPIWSTIESAQCKENINLTANVVRELTTMKMLSYDAKALCIGQRSVSAVLAMKREGISDVHAVYRPPFFPLRNRKLVTELDYEDTSFDFVFSRDLETVPVPASLVLEIERILKPGGIGAMLVSTSGSDSNSLVRSVSPVSSLLKNSSVVHVASVGEPVLVAFKRNAEDGFRFDQSPQFPADCPSVVNNKPYIDFLEPLLEEERADFERRIHYLPEFIDVVSSRKRLVYIDIGAAGHLKMKTRSWFFPSYPIDKRAFNAYFVHHNTSVLTSYVKSPGVTFIYHPGLAATKAITDPEDLEPFVEDESFDFLAWFKETVSFADFVVLKMNSSDVELKFLADLIETGTICSVDELFLRCTTGYNDCTGILKSLRSSGIFVHQWWEE
ncbi:PREDICTED: uncharacterized protein LOC104806503 isoform X2 [Tarenaya hassleriana]|nr:PREDICTED: uncharacterized protein LOC104806503 isoform X2 [Tarenaya hassleriana]